MAKPNYAFEKRQRERAKKEKKAEKAAQRKTPGDKPEDPALGQAGEHPEGSPVESSDAPQSAQGERASAVGTGTAAPAA